MTRRAWCRTWAGLACLAGCQPPPPRGPACLQPAVASGTVVARVGDTVITAERLEQRLRAQGQGRRQFETSRGLRELVEDEVRFELLARAAVDRGLYADPDVIDAARRVMVRKLLQRDLDPAVFEDAVGDEALRAFYERHRDNYLQPEKRRFAHVQLAATEEGRAAAQALAEHLVGRGEADFDAAVARASVAAEGHGHGGDEPFQTRDEVAEAFGLTFAAAVFAAAPGTVVPQPVASTRGWHVVRLLARREALSRDFEEVREQIRERLLQGQRSRQFQSYVDEIRQTYPVSIDDDRLATLLQAWSAKEH